MAETAKCKVCKNPANQKCEKCWKVYYCNEEHQFLHWESHQKICRPFKICNDEQLGSYVIATKPISNGALIFQELPLVVGPGKSKPILSLQDTIEPKPTFCMGCLKTVNNMYHRCKKCVLSLCSVECENNANHKPECYYLVRSKMQVSLMDFLHCKNELIFILRCLYHKKFNPKIWQMLYQLRFRRKEYEDTNMVQIIINTVNNALDLKNEFSEEEVHKMYDIINVNSLTTDKKHRAIYKIASSFEHNCKANCGVIFNPEHRLTIIAATAINEGDRLTLSYIPSLQPTFKRQLCLHFTCHCDRCEDVTEFGTNFSALKCREPNCKGVLLPETFLIINKKLHWMCNECDYTRKTHFNSDYHKHLEKSLQSAKCLNDYKTFLKFHQMLLSDNHCYIINAKMGLIFKIGQIARLHKVSNEDLELKISLCREMTEFLQIIAPAEKLLSSAIKYQLQTSLGAMYHRKQAASNLCKTDSIHILKERQLLLNEVLHVTKFKYSEQQHQAMQMELTNLENKLAKLEQ